MQSFLATWVGFFITLLRQTREDSLTLAKSLSVVLLSLNVWFHFGSCSKCPQFFKALFFFFLNWKCDPVFPLVLFPFMLIHVIGGTDLLIYPVGISTLHGEEVGRKERLFCGLNGGAHRWRNAFTEALWWESMGSPAPVGSWMYLVGVCVHMEGDKVQDHSRVDEGMIACTSPRSFPGAAVPSPSRLFFLCPFLASRSFN